MLNERSSLNEASINDLRAKNASGKFFGSGKVRAVNTHLIYPKSDNCFLRYQQQVGSSIGILSPIR